jgi:hypothetical protein
MSALARPSGTHFASGRAMPPWSRSGLVQRLRIREAAGRATARCRRRPGASSRARCAAPKRQARDSEREA